LQLLILLKNFGGSGRKCGEIECAILLRERGNFFPAMQVYPQMETYQQFVNHAAFVIEVFGVSAIVLGAAWATVQFFFDFRDKPQAYEKFRAHLGRGILVGLEFLVAADIIRTVGIRPTWENVGILTVIVLIRTFLSMTLSMEVNAWLPWERRRRIQGGGFRS
jgi:uncharacterized membrane protein